MNSRKPILKVSTSNQVVMYFTTLWNLLLWSTLYKDNKTNLFLLAVIIGLGIELYNKYNLFHMYSEPLVDEIKKTRREIPPSFKKHINRKKPFECTLDFNCKVINQEETAIPSSPSYSIIQVKWTIGEARIKNHLQSMFKLFDSLEKNKIIPPTKPSEFKLIRGFLPHRTYNADMPTKSRYLIYTGLPGYFAGSSLATLFDLTSSQPYFKLLFAIVSLGLNLADSYCLNDITNAYRLEGFTLSFQNYCEWPPTCIGGQLTRTIELAPGNSLIISKVLPYVMDGEVFIEKVKKNNLTDSIVPPLDYETKKLLENFEPLIEHQSYRV